MSKLRQKIKEDLNKAVMAKDKEKRDTLRFLDSMIKNVEIEKGKREEGLTDKEVIEVITRSAKQHKESITQYEKGDRPELAQKEKQELEILEAYLPKQLSEEEVRAKVRQVIAQVGASSPKDMGEVMKAVMPQLSGKADGSLVKKIVNDLLS